MAKTVKPPGQSADAKRLKLHGSAPKRGMAKAGGQLRRLREKPQIGRKR